MRNFQIWSYVLIAVAIALLANSVSSIWAKGDNKFSVWLLALLVISPFVFLSFGFVTSKVGLAISSGVIDSLLTITTIATGLILFHEWNKVSFLQYLGMFFAFVGIMLMLFSPKADN
jgi:drug/metabolite transporter (DMT)-like permease